MSTTGSPRIIARYGNRVIGWVGSEKKCRLYGDEEWVASATAASQAHLEFTLYNGLSFTADVDDYKNPAGAFAALAWFAKERIDIREAPEGLMASMGLLEHPESIAPLFDEDNVTDEDVEFAEKHLHLIIDGEDQWLPLDKFMAGNDVSVDRIREILKK